MSEEYKLLVCIGNEGLEAVIDLGDLERVDEETKKVMTYQKLASDNPSEIKFRSKLAQVMGALEMRFRLNGHRNIKKYILNFCGDDYDFLWDWARRDSEAVHRMLKLKGYEVKF